MKTKNFLKSACMAVLAAFLFLSAILPKQETFAKAADIEQLETITLDFKEFAASAANQSWWKELRAAADNNTKYIGCPNSASPMSDLEKKAYSELRSFAAENYGWTIDETSCCFGNSYYIKQLFFNSDPDIPWGISYYAWYLGMPERNKLTFSFQADEAGWYHLDIQAFHENTTGAFNTTQTTGLYAGSGYGDIYVNDSLVYDDYCFAGENETLKRGLGVVYLNKGENTVTVAEVMDHVGKQSSGRRLINLKSMEFTQLGDLYVRADVEKEIDLTQSYFPFDTALSPNEFIAASADSEILDAEFTESGMLRVFGITAGRTTIGIEKNGEHLFDIPVSVVVDVSGKEELRRVSYLVNEFEALTLRYGDVAEGTLAAISNFRNEYGVEIIREYGDIYFVSDNTSVARVDQAKGDVTCVGEGTATITAYVKIGDKMMKDFVQVVVTDDTDLASVELVSTVDYVGVGNVLQISAEGLKSSGGPADMSNFPVVYTVDCEDIAVIDENGRLTALSEGTVTVTGTCGVMKTAVTDTMAITVVKNSELAGRDVLLDFTDGRALALKTAALEKDGFRLNTELTVAGGDTLSYATKHGVSLPSAKLGDCLAIDFVVQKDGWYVIETWGSLFSYGAVTDVYVDDAYVGIMDFYQGKGLTYSGNSIMNTIYLEAGSHTCVLECTKRGSFFLGKIICRAASDPKDMEVLLTAPEQLLKGQTAEVELNIKTQNSRGIFTLKDVDVQEKPNYTNFCKITSSASQIVSVEGNILTAVGEGNAVISLSGEINHNAFETSVAVSVVNGTIFSAALSAEETTMKPTASGTTLMLTAYDVDGNAVPIPGNADVLYYSEDPSVAVVSADGSVAVKGKEGTTRITAIIVEDTREVEASIWITVTSGKTEPTIFTYEERNNAIENVSKYAWAANLKNAAVRTADKVVANLDTYYDNFIYQAFPRTTRVGTRTDPEAYYCRLCNTDLASIYGVYPWIVDPINNPWKITCPVCKCDFPSNDFEAYYKSGLGSDGRFRAEDADGAFLVNELYPEMGQQWGVDDGFGYDTGRTYSNGAREIHTYIGYYMHCVFDSLSKYSVNDMVGALTALQNAYLYTGNEKYGSAGAILIDRIADIYPEYDYYSSDSLYGGFDKGKIVNAIWEAVTIGQCLAQAADAFWPAMDNADVIEYLQKRASWKGVSAEEITPEYIRKNVDEGILLQIRAACESGNSLGNFGMHQASMAYAAVALDRLPETQEMIDWIFRYGENQTISSREMIVTGGNVLYRLVNDVDRDGIGNEGSNMYNPMWFQNLMEVANALNGYTRVEGVDLWRNPKFVTMFNALNRLVLCGTAMVTTGEAGFVQSYGSYADAECMLEAFIQTGNRELARGLYYTKGNSVAGLHGSIFTKNPEEGIQNAILQIVEEDGPWVWNRSEMLCGEGIAILRNGPEQLQKGVNNDQFSDYWMFFGICGGSHGAHEALNIGVEAFGLIASPTLGYPKVVNTADPERMQWMLNTVSHNTVVVNDKCQSKIAVNSFPLHFDDVGEVKIADAEAPGAYGETDIYRRTLVSVKAEENVYYAVDFFRVLGGKEHVYSFHAASTIMPETEGLDFVHQPMGTYAGPEVEFGSRQVNPDTTDAAANTGSGYSWLDNVYRDDCPEETFSVDFEIEDFKNTVMNSEGVRMRLTMLSNETMSEVAIADGHPTQNGRNPDVLKYLLVRRSGREGLDTLFTSLIQPYRDEAYISSVELLDVVAISENERAADKAAALKVTLTSGRVDYIVYASDPNVTYRVEENGVEIFRFCGFVGVCSYQNGEVIYAYGNEVSILEEASGKTLLKEETPCVTGTVTAFTEGLSDNYTMTVAMDVPVSEDALPGRYIYVNNDGLENGAYQIYGAKVSGNTAVLDLHTQTLARSYADENDMGKGFIHNIQRSQSYKIPLSAEADCFHARSSVSYTSDGKGYHTIVKRCVACKKVLSTIIAACKDGSDSDAKCDRCGAEMPKEIKIDIAGSNMTLGNRLTINFVIKKEDLQVTGCTAIVTQTLADGTTRVTRVAQEDWVIADIYYKVSAGVAAKEMADMLTIEIIDQNGSVINNAYTTSVRDYAGKVLSSSESTKYIKTMVVDMLNYGTAAQYYFDYNTGKLANGLLSEEQKADATVSVSCANNQIKGTNYHGTNLSLEESILLNMYIGGMKGKDVSSMWAEISFESYFGAANRIKVPGSEFAVYKTGIYKITVDDIVLADARQPVTVTVYNADGTVHGFGTDSVESYVARAASIDDQDLYSDIMKFAVSAYNYLTNR